ncbi:GreA/GreB family elongation factor [Maribacter chungangensis]|uniref:GreA/GreB family elongation factor n=1 Tax=Maribacter chungangensis TaxID=1069117 RepID=A0ABW3B7Z3_9FLAO
MKYTNLIIEKKEYVILKRVLNISGYHQDITLRKAVGKLVKELESAKICDEVDMPADVVRFNSEVTIVSENGWHKKFQLVLPKSSDVKNNKISLLTPMGAAVMGYAEGDSLVWEFPSGEQNLTIEKVSQENIQINVNMIL